MTDDTEITLKSLHRPQDGLARRTEVSEQVGNADLAEVLERDNGIGGRIRELVGSRPLTPLFHARTRRERQQLLEADSDLPLAEIDLDETSIEAPSGQARELRRVEVECIHADPGRRESLGGPVARSGATATGRSFQVPGRPRGRGPDTFHAGIAGQHRDHGQPTLRRGTTRNIAALFCTDARQGSRSARRFSRRGSRNARRGTPSRRAAASISRLRSDLGGGHPRSCARTDQGARRGARLRRATRFSGHDAGVTCRRGAPGVRARACTAQRAAQQGALTAAADPGLAASSRLHPRVARASDCGDAG